MELIRTPLEEVLVLSAADGAGSAGRGGDGARVVCDFFLDDVAQLAASGRLLSGCLDHEWGLSLMQALFHRVVMTAEEAGEDAGSFATTFLGAVVGSDFAAFLQIGDGAIVIRKPEGLSSVFWPQEGEYAGTTNFVTSANLLDEFCFGSLAESIDEIAVFTDGLQRLCLDFQTRTPHSPFFDPMLQRLRHEPAGLSGSLSDGLESFLKSETVCTRTSDDKTLLLATRFPSPPG